MYRNDGMLIWQRGDVLQIYLDAVFLLNFIVDFLLIMGTNRLAGYQPDGKRAVFGAVIGGIYGAICLLPDLRFLGNLLWRMVFFALLAMAAFGLNRSAWSRGAVLMLLSMALGGIAAGANAQDFAAVCLCGVLVTVLCTVGFGRQRIGQTCIPIQLRWKNRCVDVLALHDTGNTLRDPLTGEQVLVCGADVGAQLFEIPESSFTDPAALLASGMIPGLRLIPFHTVGQSAGLLVALRLRNVRIGRIERDAVVAFSPQRIGSGAGYRMLTGGMF